MSWIRQLWVDDDGSLTVGTEFTAPRMNNIEVGIMEDHDFALAASGIAGSALIMASGASGAMMEEPPFPEQDAFSISAIETATFSFTHPGGSLKHQTGVLVLIAQDFSTSVADQVSGVTYGGELMTRIGVSLTANKGAIYAYLLRDRVKRGPQTVKVTTTGSAKKQAMCVSFVGPPERIKFTFNTTVYPSSTAPNISSVTLWDERLVYGVLDSAKNPITPQATTIEMGSAALGSAAFNHFARLRTPAQPGDGGFVLGFNSPAGSATIGAVSIGLPKNWGEVTVLPEAELCAVGDTCSFVADEANNLVWECEFDNRSTTRPWRVISAQPLRKQETGSPAFSTSLKTEGAPTITLPATMDFDVEYGSAIAFSTGQLANARFIIFINEVEQTDNVRTYAREAGQPVAHKTFNLAGTSGQVVRIKYICESFTGAASTGQMYMAIHPKRIG